MAVARRGEEHLAKRCVSVDALRHEGLVEDELVLSDLRKHQQPQRITVDRERVRDAETEEPRSD